MLLRYIFLISLILLGACKNSSVKNDKVMQEFTEKDWEEKLTPEEYYVLRQKGTERPFTGEYNDFDSEGSYHCKGCGQELFNSETKFNAHCGWPSFDEALKGSVSYIEDRSHGMLRTEVVCSNCQSHLGHVFNDGPAETTGMRYCMNSISLQFKETK